jgi:Ca-activated chloride channel family protein
MFRFHNPEILYFLILIPFLVVLFVYATYIQNKRLNRFGDAELLRGLMPNVSYVRPKIKFYVVLIALTLLIFAAARPQFGTKLESRQTQGVEAIVLLDVSNSMLAQDIQPNRLDYAKLLLSKIFDRMSEDRVGLIVFAGDAYVQLPLTSDNVSAKMFLSYISTQMVPRPGTAIGSAIDMAINSFGDKENAKIGRTIILLTDGENHEDDAVAAAKLAAQYGITVNVIGLGSPDGVPIPTEGTMSFLKDRDGNIVVSKLNESMCRQIAEAGQGVYIRADNSNAALRVLTGEIEKMQKGNLDAKVYSDYDDRFYMFVWIAFVLLLLEYYLLERQNSKLNKIKWFD